MKKKESSRVLVIDDDLVLATLDKMLKAEMFSVDVSVSARDALGRLPETRYDAIICDMWMPGMTGKDFYNQVEKEFPDYLGRIIFLTGDIASEATWDFIEEKRLPYLLKPVSQPELRRKLQQVIGEELKVPSKKGPEHRRQRRLAMKANLRVRKKRWATGGPEIAPVGNASKDGVFFVTDRQYEVGTEVMVSCPYSGPGDLEQEGRVVRVDARSDGRRGVAIALGKAATAARATLAPPELSGVEPIAEAADMKLQLDRERKEAHRLTDELADLKASYEQAAGERDRLATQESDRDFRLSELTSARDATSHLVEESKQQVQDLLGQLATVKRDQARQAELAVGAQEETAQVADLKKELDQVREEARQPAQELAELKGAYDRLVGDRDRLVTQESGLSSQLRELTSARDTTSRLVEELKQQVQDLQGKLAVAEREQARQAELAVGARQETAHAADLKKDLDQEQEAARRLTQDLAGLKAVHEGVVQERDRLLTQESGLSAQLRELTYGMSRLVEELKQQVQDLQGKLAVAEREQARQAELAVGARQETAHAADLKKDLDQEQETARRLTQDLADLKAVYEGVVQERDRLLTQESGHNSQLRELTSTRDTMNRLMEELRKKINGLETHVAGVEAERDQARKETGAARAETQKWRAESRRQQQAAASTERAAQEQASSANEQKGEVAKLREDLKGLQARIQDFRDAGVGPLTNLAASCDLIAMKRSLDADTKKSAKEISQMAAQLRKAFQKLTRKK